MAEAFVAQNPDCVQPNLPAQIRLKSGSSRTTDLFALRRTPLRAKSGCEQLQQTAALFNHLVGAGEQRWRALRCRVLSQS
jgi:hypothetical protein